ncbi:Serine/threonine-protein kinase PrkC [bacterium HR36]|nr:Serine/threonine-protein kinase PrkC [bacterium HR36]
MSDRSLSSAQELEANGKGLEIPGYQIEALLHQGQAASVYKARQVALDRPVAIKLLHSVHREGNGHPSSQQHEAWLRAKLSHPNIVTVYDAGEIGGNVYFVMEYVAGESLREQMRRGQPWRTRRALSVLQAVASALDYIHARGLLHLDLKPENVLLTETGVAKITDFGISQWIHQVDGASMLWGTGDYCAPEQRFGLGVDRRADVFSLAVLAYELLTGYLPGRVYISARRRNRFLPSCVDKVLAKGLARDKEERYDSAGVFYQDLAEALLNYRQHPVWGSLAALGIAALVAIPLLVERSLWFVPSGHGSSGSPTDTSPSVAPPDSRVSAQPLQVDTFRKALRDARDDKPGDGP